MMPRTKVDKKVALLVALLLLAGFSSAARRPAPGEVVEGPVVELLPGVFKATYELYLRPLAPGEVMKTDPASTLLKTPSGKNAFLSFEAELLSEKDTPVPINELYNHHFVVHSLPLSDDSVSSFNIAGGAEWRGVQAQLAFNPTAPDASKVPSSAFMHDSSDAQLGLTLHVIDLRGVDRCGSWEGNKFDNRWPAGVGALPCAAADDPSLMRGIAQCIQCNCAYFQLNNNNVTVRPKAPLSGGLSCCTDGLFCDLGGRYTAPDGGLLWPEERRRKFSSGLLPDDEPWSAEYVFQYNITYRAWDDSTQPLFMKTFKVESSARSNLNGLLSTAEYQPATCGLCKGKSCGPYADYYSSIISATFGADKQGYDEGSAPPQTYPFTRAEFIDSKMEMEAGSVQTFPSGLSRCELGSLGVLDNRVMSVLSFSWVAPYDVDVHFAYAHQHVGGLGVKLYVQGAGFGSVRNLLCHSVPTYGKLGASNEGFLISISVCDFRTAPIRLPKGTVVSVESFYWADAMPFPVVSADGASSPSPFQLPWTGAMGFLNIIYSVVSWPSTGLWTANGMQPSFEQQLLLAKESQMLQM